MKKQTTGLFLGLLGVTIFGGTLPFTRLGTQTFDPWFLTFSRAAIVSIVSVIVFIFLKRRLDKKHIPQLFIIGVLLVFGFPGFMALAMTTVPASHGGVVLGILPLATAVFAVILARERPSPLFWICGVIGAILIVIFALRDGGWGFEIGDLWLGVAGLCAAAGYVISGKLSHILPPWEVISWALVLTLPISLLFCLIYWEPEYINADSQALTALAYVSFGSMYFGFFAWNAGLKLGGISTVGQLQLLQTFITIGISAVILDEQISSEMIGFACLIVLVVMIGRKAQVKKA